MSEYKIIRLTTLKQYESNKSINIAFSYDFQDGDNETITLNKLLIPNLVSLTHSDITTSLEETGKTYYKTFHGDYVTGIEVDDNNSLDENGNKIDVPIKERSWIVLGKKGE
jgi:hypothetical protein